MSTNDEILERIRKVMAYTSSPNQHEAAVAAEKVQELLEAHNLTIHDLHAFSEEQVSRDVYSNIVDTDLQYSNNIHAPLRGWHEALIWGLGKIFEVKAIRQKREGMFRLIGEEISVNAIIMLYHWLVTQLEVSAAGDWKQYITKVKQENDGTAKGNHIDPLVFRGNYFTAAVGVILKRLEDKKQKQVAETMALVRIVGKEIEHYMQDHGVKTVPATVTSNTRWNDGARTLGRAAGERASITTSNQVSETGSKRRLTGS